MKKSNSTKVAWRKEIMAIADAFEKKIRAGGFPVLKKDKLDRCFGEEESAAVRLDEAVEKLVRTKLLGKTNASYIAVLTNTTAAAIKSGEEIGEGLRGLAEQSAASEIVQELQRRGVKTDRPQFYAKKRR